MIDFNINGIEHVGSTIRRSVCSLSLITLTSNSDTDTCCTLSIDHLCIHTS
jgi:hypothetical protein